MLLSVIVPVYNTEKYLKQCIESILAQKVSDMELILVDDGSTDGSGAICDAYARLNECVKVIHKEWSGPQDTRLVGAECACGKYITFVDSDDWIRDTMYKELLPLVCEKDADMIISGISRYYNAEQIIEEKMYLEEGYYSSTDIEQKIIPCMIWGKRKNDWELDPSLCTKLVKRGLILKFLKQSKVLNIHNGDDPVVTYPMMLETNSVIVKNKSYYFHRLRPVGCIPSYVSDPEYFDKLYTVYNYLRECLSKSKHWNVLQEQVERYYMRTVLVRKMCYEVVTPTNVQPVDLFPFERVSAEHRVILYGAGNVGKTFKKQNDQYHFCNMVAWVDKKHMECPAEWKVVSPKEICKIDFDYVIIAVGYWMLAKEIMRELEEQGVPKEKIIWESVRAENLVDS